MREIAIWIALVVAVVIVLGSLTDALTGLPVFGTLGPVGRVVLNAVLFVVVILAAQRLFNGPR